MGIAWDRLALSRFCALHEGEALLFVAGSPRPGIEPPADIPLVVYTDEPLPGKEAYPLRLLARVMNPTLASHDLGDVLAHYGIPPGDRGIPEAIGRLFSSMIEETIGLDRGVLALLARLLPMPLSGLLSRIAPLPPPPPDRSAAEAPPPEAEPPSAEPSLDEALGPDGAVARRHPAYEFRPGQLDMARDVAARFAAGGALAVEAGPGTGKTFAYLIPAILRLREEESSRLVVSTRTKQLQEQLYTKDLPFLISLFGPGLKTALLKGRNNYLCLRRWEALVAELSESLERDRLVTLAPLVRWLIETDTGDVEENKAFLSDPAGRELWERLADSPYHCLEGLCPHFDECFSIRARRRARAADLVVVNHSLLLGDVAAAGLVLGNYDHLVVDEAHSLEDAARKAFTASLSQRIVERFAAELVPSRPHRRGWLRRIPLPPDRVREAADAVASLRTASVRLFAALADRLPAVQRGAITAVPGLTEGLDGIERAARLLGAELEGIGERLEEPDLKREAAGYADRADELIRVAAMLKAGPEEETVHWFERVAGGISLNVTPLEVAPILAGALYPRLRSIVLTSATISLAGDFDFLCQTLGLSDAFPEVRTRVVNAPFFYAERMRICVPTFLPPISDEPDGYADGLADLLMRVQSAIDRKGLVLFTSYRMLNAVRERLDRSVTVLAQGVDGARSGLIERFRRHRGGILLFGTDSFWEGVDLPGEDLELLVVTRLPFSVPTDPINAALGAHYERLGRDPFLSLSLPQAIIRLRQGVGRLIRTRIDRGVVLITDGRILSKGYGEGFRAALPVPIEPFSDPDSLIAEVTAWFGDPD